MCQALWTPKREGGKIKRPLQICKGHFCVLGAFGRRQRSQGFSSRSPCEPETRALGASRRGVMAPGTSQPSCRDSSHSPNADSSLRALRRDLALRRLGPQGSFYNPGSLFCSGKSAHAGFRLLPRADPAARNPGAERGDRRASGRDVAGGVSWMVLGGRGDRSPSWGAGR